MLSQCGMEQHTVLHTTRLTVMDSITYFHKHEEVWEEVKYSRHTRTPPNRVHACACLPKLSSPCTKSLQSLAEVKTLKSDYAVQLLRNSVELLGLGNSASQLLRKALNARNSATYSEFLSKKCSERQNSATYPRVTRH